MNRLRTICEVNPGTHLSKAGLEAVKIAIETETNVEFDFNGTAYEVIYNDIISLVNNVE